MITIHVLDGLDWDRLYTVREVATILKISVRTLLRRCREGKLAYVKVKRYMRFTLEAVHNYIEKYYIPEL